MPPAEITAETPTSRRVFCVQPVAAIVGSSNFTGPGLTTNKELNLSHKTLLTEEEVAQIGPPPVDGLQEMELRQQLMSGVGAQAISELDNWFRQQWEASRDFKGDLIELLDASKFGQKASSLEPRGSSVRISKALARCFSVMR